MNITDMALHVVVSIEHGCAKGMGTSDLLLGGSQTGRGQGISTPLLQADRRKNGADVYLGLPLMRTDSC